MKLLSVPRTLQYRSRVTVRPGANGLLHKTKLDRAIALAWLAVVVLCAARVASDWHRNALSIEGSIALSLLVVFASLPLAKAIHPANRAPASLQDPLSSTCSNSTTSRARSLRLV